MPPKRPAPAPAPPSKPELRPLERSLFGHLSHWLVAGWSRVREAWFRWAQLNQSKAWFPFFIATVVGIDSIIIILPGDVLVALAVLSNPAAWRRIAFYAGMGATIGAFTLYLLLVHYGKAPLNKLAELGAPTGMQDLSELSANTPDLEAGLAAVAQSPAPKWERFRAFFAKFGLASLALGSVIPLFSWPPVILAGLSTDRWWEVLFWLIIGRQARYWIGCFGLREGWAMFQALREEAQAQRESKAHKH